MKTGLKIYSTNHMSFHVCFDIDVFDKNQSHYNIITINSENNIAFRYNTEIFNYDESIPRRAVMKMLYLKYIAKNFESSLEKYKKERKWYLA